VARDREICRLERELLAVQLAAARKQGVPWKILSQDLRLCNRRLQKIEETSKKPRNPKAR
jgi:hypothetical protein